VVKGWHCSSFSVLLPFKHSNTCAYCNVQHLTTVLYMVLKILKILVRKINILCLFGKGYSTGEPAARMNGTFGYLGLITLLGK
jgi:hypothetical protein